MNPIDQHLEELLPEGWRYDIGFRGFNHGRFTVAYGSDTELQMRHNGDLLASVPVRPTENIHQVHSALQALFAHLPRYDVRLVREQG